LELELLSRIAFDACFASIDAYAHAFTPAETTAIGAFARLTSNFGSVSDAGSINGSATSYKY
jgi:hypothetical protein